MEYSQCETPVLTVVCDDGHLLRGRQVVAGGQPLVGAGFNGDAESFDQYVERGGLGKAAAHGRQFTWSGLPVRGFCPRGCSFGLLEQKYQWEWKGYLRVSDFRPTPNILGSGTPEAKN